MADHLDDPGLTSPAMDARVDITDHYAFQKPGDPDRTILILNVNPLAPTHADEFRSDAVYETLVDTDGDAQPNIAFRYRFTPKEHGNQFAHFARAEIPQGALGDQSGGFSFRAAGGLPEAPLPSYATQVVEGQVDVARGTGLVTSRVLAGHPDGTSVVGLPGLGRMIRVTAVDAEHRTLRLRGTIEDRSQLRRGESPAVEILVDRRRGVVHAPFLGRQRELKLAKP